VAADDTLTMAEAALELGISYYTMKRIVARREIAVERFSRSVVRIHRRDLDDYRLRCYHPAVIPHANGNGNGMRPTKREREVAAEHARARDRVDDDVGGLPGKTARR
jgi:excisionase family DNA binding protein